MRVIELFAGVGGSRVKITLWPEIEVNLMES